MKLLAESFYFIQHIYLVECEAHLQYLLSNRESVTPLCQWEFVEKLLDSLQLNVKLINQGSCTDGASVFMALLLMAYDPQSKVVDN